MARDDLRLTDVGAGQVPLDSADCWQAAFKDTISWREWGDEFVVHIGSRASTHLLSPAAGNVMLGLIDSPRAVTIETLFDRVFGESAGLSMTDEERSSLLGIVLDLNRLGLAKRLPP